MPLNGLSPTCDRPASTLAAPILAGGLPTRGTALLPGGQRKNLPTVLHLVSTIEKIKEKFKKRDPRGMHAMMHAETATRGVHAACTISTLNDHNGTVCKAGSAWRSSPIAAKSEPGCTCESWGFLEFLGRRLPFCIQTSATVPIQPSLVPGPAVTGWQASLAHSL